MSPRLSTAYCDYCGEKMAGDDPLQAYHIYKIHPERLRESFEKGYKDIPEILRKTMSKEIMYRILLAKMHEIDRQENSLI